MRRRDQYTGTGRAYFTVHGEKGGKTDQKQGISQRDFASVRRLLDSSFVLGRHKLKRPQLLLQFTVSATPSHRRTHPHTEREVCWKEAFTNWSSVSQVLGSFGGFPLLGSDPFCWRCFFTFYLGSSSVLFCAEQDVEPVVSVIAWRSVG
ncbi:uncharacterized protein J3R85_010703 [Psidium guajava]|nr:uncharacterized protein J3R85_010703 [Psidium guajava]